MQYSTYFSTSPLSSSAVSSNSHQFQQNIWNYEYSEDGTSVTYPPVVNKCVSEILLACLQHIYEASSFRDGQQYPAILDESLQEVTPSMSIWMRKLQGFTKAKDLQSLIKILLDWDRRSLSIPLLSAIMLQQVERFYCFRDTEVKQFLTDFPFLVQILLDTYDKIQLIFPKSQLFLEVVVDYEMFADANKELFLSIATALPPEAAMEKLNMFYTQWWLQASRDAERKISVGLELV